MEKVNIGQVPRVENVQADTIVKLTTSLQGKIPKMILVELLHSKIIDQKHFPTVLTLIKY